MQNFKVFLLALCCVVIGATCACAYEKEFIGRAYVITVVFSDFTVHVYDPEGIELFFSAVALPRKTPKLPIEGRLLRIERNPAWYPTKNIKAYVLKTQKIVLPDIVPPGPDNPMGPVKFTFEFFTPGADQLSKMHGTNSPRSIGKKATAGCIRLYNEEILAVADLIEPFLLDGEEIRIRYVNRFDDNDALVAHR
ncbi:MAG: ErfK/YbiS/YcfS/YnhG family protein [uncultured bacterium]|uniref:ErfK/YbiS/YcfS/YnhG family protein n=1 Tax=Candidatus Wolfebacteria bacterium GW2011_GWE2_44_13 TaxID=1619017 RepID=A0A0G1HBA3_9BACT|nr:MAG: ErfK/YbiS/YcfS/YnhG family protein [uncultured bacterium]KKT43808.1 MAG: ErfK/YbiS/YcfS/YnhG family protein [Candidatus Wolfebacteria bacterium GW2011_GWE2_44_13]